MLDLPRSTISDIAILARTTKENVARVMLGKSGVPLETQKRIVDAIRVLSDLHNETNEQHVIGVVLLGPLAEDAYHSWVARGIAEAANELNRKIMIHMRTPQEGSDYLEMLQKNHLAGGMIIVNPFEDAPLIRFCERYEVPHVLIDRHIAHRIDQPGRGFVTAQNYEGGVQAMEYLIQHGHRRIAHLFELTQIESSADRTRAYRDTLHSHSIPFEPALMIEVRQGDTGGEAAMAALLQQPQRPTAVFAVNDRVAWGVQRALRRAGSAISVVGFDDLSASAHSKPPLTTVHVPMLEMGRAALRMIVKMIDSGEVPDAVRLPTHLVIRESTAAAVH